MPRLVPTFVCALALAVTARNAPARALYDRMGMTEAGGYHYRIAPAEGA